jgi:16S rRNA (uracil1498-N3)-methyltransferase
MVIKQVIAPNEYKTHVILCQALIAEQALDFVIQKATELGAYKVCIFQAEHSPRKLQIDKHARWNRIAAEAAKQCGRVRGAEIASEKFETLLLQASKNSGYYFSQEATTKIQQKQAATKPGQELFLFIGPEGGWSEKEINFFGAHQIPALELSPFTLRAETAALAALSQFSLYLK